MANIVETFLLRPIRAVARAIGAGRQEGKPVTLTLASSDGVRPRVLCVDDNPDILRVLKRQLGQRFDLSIAQTANDALALMGRAPFDVIISDLRMPDVHGLVFLKKARQLAPSSERIILTGQADPTTMSVARGAAGTEVLINKPWSKDELIEAVDSAVQRRRAKGAAT